MNAVEIEQAISDLALQPFDATEFPYAFLAAFGNKETTLKRLRTGNNNATDLPGGVLLRNNIHIAVCEAGNVGDPFLHQYESEYHYLFKRVHDEAHKAMVPGLEAYYAIPNIARRLLEAFLAFRIPDKPGELFQKLECIDYDAAKKTRILRFLHTYSHFDQVAEPDHDPSVLSETPAILLEVLELMRACDAAHFTSMEQLVTSTAAQ